ncbi:MAG TPA: colicin E5-related ribonuclease [Tepidisphaeraceae bacterium]|nr:colicin E5-related ribonuclease [Tepidisphaeraceae bacterium]
MEPLRFSNEKKLRKQMRKRGWTEQEFREALATMPTSAKGKLHDALRYRHPVTGRTVLVDAVTGEIFHVGTGRYRYG